MNDNIQHGLNYAQYKFNRAITIFCLVSLLAHMIELGYIYRLEEMGVSAVSEVDRAFAKLSKF